MADLEINYKGSKIAELSASGTKTLKTSGKYCEGDITVTYTDPEKETQSKTVTPTASGFTVTPDSGKVLSNVVVNGDNELIASNVRKDINIFGVTGTLVEGITPSGTKSITANGTYDVTNYASALVAISANPKIWEITVPSDSNTITIVTGDSDIANHYADTNAIATFVMQSSWGSSSEYHARMFLTANHSIMTSDSTGTDRYSIKVTHVVNHGGLTLTSTRTDAWHIMCNSSGDLTIVSPSDTIKTGTYLLAFGW